MDANNQTDQKLPELLPTESAFGIKTFDHAQRVAKMLASSNLIPKEYQGNIQNTMIALEMANRIGASPLMVMQNLYIVYGRPSWSSSFIIAALNSCKKFSPLRFEMGGEGDEYGCRAWANELSGKERLDGPKVTMKMAKAEGWVTKNGSKWQTMPELMLRYRAAAFFGRLYAPEIMMGMHTQEEIIDIEAPIIPDKVDKLQERISLLIDDAKTVDDLKKIEGDLPDTLLDKYTVKLDELTEKQNA